MAFNTAVSGLRAANNDLSVIGNNIANASTIGAKSSRAEFADLYASSTLGNGGNTIGNGVILSSVKQTFTQGNISFTNNSLDMAINGRGFFMLDNDGAIEYTRAGFFGVNNDGNLVGSGDRLLMGFPASATGAVSGTLGTIQLSAANLPPRQTTSGTFDLNLNAGEVPPAERGSTASSQGGKIGVAQLGASNGYSAETITVTSPTGAARRITTEANASAKSIASQINSLPHVSASATTYAELSEINDAGTLQISLNGIPLLTSTGADDITPQDIAIAINQLTNSTLRGISAIHDEEAGTVTVTSNNGEDLAFTLGSASVAGDTFTVKGLTDDEIELTGAAGAVRSATVGGSVSITLDKGATIDTNGNGTGLFADDIITSPFVRKSFDPDDQDTYNHATSLNVYDSLGNAHVMSSYFVKEDDVNTWTMYLQIDGQNVGDPNRALPAPDNLTPTLASFALVFNNDGSLDEAASDDVRVTYWNPIDTEGELNGALEGLPVSDGAVFPLTEPLTSSNFEINISGITQFGSPFAVNDVAQDGYTTGRVKSVDISQEGVIFARYTNGQSLIRGQLALANFRNEQGLQPIGDSSWVETFDSGNSVIGSPGTASLGSIQSVSLEESNIDLSQELVKLIIAQRNVQANAKTIETADQTTQAILQI
jgi:flagellar hook protein FlgE